MTITVKTCCFVVPLKIGVFLIGVLLILNSVFEIVLLVILPTLPSVMIGNGFSFYHENISFVLDLIFNIIIAGCLFYAVPFHDSGFIGIPGVILFIVNFISSVVYIFKGVADLAPIPLIVALLCILKVYFSMVLWSYADKIARDEDPLQIGSENHESLRGIHDIYDEEMTVQ